MSIKILFVHRRIRPNSIFASCSSSSLSGRSVSTSSSNSSGMYSTSSSMLFGIDGALRQACSLQCPQIAEHCNPTFLHLQFAPQPFFQLQNILLNNSSGGGGNNVVIGCRTSFCKIHLHFSGCKSVPNQVWIWK